jgi:hypothetical protein
MLVEEFRDYVERRVFGGREEDPDVTGGLVNDQEVTGITVIRPDHPIGAVVWARVVRRRGPHKTKVHVKTFLTLCGPNSRALGSLFPDAGLLLKVDEPEWVILEYGRDASDVAREGVELMDPGGT